MFDRPLELWRPAHSPDGMGGSTETYVKVGSQPLMAKVDQPGSEVTDDQLVADQARALLRHSIYFDGIVDVRRGDELRDAAGSPTAESFSVFAVVRPSEPIYTKALAEAQQHEDG